MQAQWAFCHQIIMIIVENNVLSLSLEQLILNNFWNETYGIELRFLKGFGSLKSEGVCN